MENSLSFISCDDISFYSSPYGLLMLKYKGEDIGRVSVLRMFPFEHKEEYLCIKKENYNRSDKESEIGILKSLDALSEEQAELVRAELEKRYFIPEIIKVNSVKEEYGHTMWKVETTAGEREFTVNDMGTNVRNMGNNRVMLTDVYSNRYYIPDITKADDKTIRIIEIWI